MSLVAGAAEEDYTARQDTEGRRESDDSTRRTFPCAEPSQAESSRAEPSRISSLLGIVRIHEESLWTAPVLSGLIQTDPLTVRRTVLRHNQASLDLPPTAAPRTGGYD